jgi:hypothetical protein
LIGNTGRNRLFAGFEFFIIAGLRVNENRIPENMDAGKIRQYHFVVFAIRI